MHINFSLRFIILLLNLSFPLHVYTQWHHLSGSQTIETLSDYTVPYPGGLASHTMVIDRNRSYLYVFGGMGLDDHSGVAGFLNDLWLYDIGNNVWEYVSGRQTINPGANYTEPYPGGVSGHCMVIDSIGRYLYVFGGRGFGSDGLGWLNDLWRFDLVDTFSLSRWTHVSGNMTKDLYADYDVPYVGGLFGSTMVIGRADDQLYVFGGQNSDRDSVNDLWKYVISSNSWVLLSGSGSVNTLPDYAVPYPGALYDHTMVIDGTDQFLYVHGGRGFNGSDIVDDLWRYDLVVESWSHLYENKSVAIVNIPPDYVVDYPGSLCTHSMVIDSRDNYMYVFGGIGFNGIYNNLWKYDIVNNEWAFLNGNQSTYVNVSMSVYYPGSVFETSMMMDGNYLYVFGGAEDNTESLLNDMWEFLVPETSVSSAVIPPLKTGIDTSVYETTQTMSSTQSRLTSQQSVFVTQSEVSVPFQSKSEPEISQSVVIIDNDNISNTTIIDGDVIFIDTNEDGSNNVIIIDDAQISSNGTISIYTDIVLEGDSTITTTKCISAYNNSKIIIDLTTREKGEKQVLAYNCLTVPNLDVELRGSYRDGCIPRYEVKQTSLILIFDTTSCQNKDEENTGLMIGIVGGIVAILIIIGIVVAIVFSNDNIRRSVLTNNTKPQTKREKSSEHMVEITSKMNRVDNEIEQMTNKVIQLNAILDE